MRSQQTSKQTAPLTRRSSPLLVAGFSALILLIFFSGLALRQRAQRIEQQVMETQRAYTQLDRVLAELRFQTLSLAIEFRDYLLEDSPAASGSQRAKVAERGKQLFKALDGLAYLPANSEAAVREVRKQTESYWDAVNTALTWPPAEKRPRWAAFERSPGHPSRQGVLDQSERLGEMNRAFLDQRQSSLREALDGLRTYLFQVLAGVLILGLAIAGVTVVKITRLEAGTEKDRQDLTRLSLELRHLSQELVHVQEAERKSLSRELHDEVGQMMTALRMELGNTEALLKSSPEEARAHLKSAATLAEQTLRSARNLARGLRPSMLDELGVGSALNWLVREFTRHTGIRVNLTSDDSLDHLPESYRTCIYRVVQEALTNCARHAQANEVQLDVRREGSSLAMTIQDDGIGFDAAQGNGTKGIGILGMKERVRELAGDLTIVSSPGHGTKLTVQVPLHAEATV
jgi:signal transduction histidine kinase